MAKPKPTVTTILKTGKADRAPVFGLLVLATYTLLWGGSLASPLTLAMLAATQRWLAFFVTAFVLACCYIPFQGPVPAVRRFYARYGPRFFSECSLNFEGTSLVELKQGRPTIYSFHPHGIFCIGWGIALLQEEFSGVYSCVSSVLVASPIFRLFMKITSGFPSAVDRGSLKSIMSKTKSLAILPGGFEEATLHSSSCDRVFIKSRFGFIKLALQHGYAVCACYTVGEGATFENLQGAWKIRHWLNAQGLPGIVPFGWPMLPVVPNPASRLHVWVSEPLHLPLIANPTKEQVAEWHAKYVDLLKDLHARHKEPSTPTLEVW